MENQEKSMELVYAVRRDIVGQNFRIGHTYEHLYVIDVTEG